MKRQTSRKPIHGPEFDADQMNEGERITAYVETLQYYRPKGRGKLIAEGRAMLKADAKDSTGQGAAFEFDNEWKDEVETLLTEWARRVERHDYISFGPFDHSGDVGFYISPESALEDVDLRVEGSEDIPRGFSGLVAIINDHGNVTVSTYSRGRKCRELFAVV